ncbi:adhesion G-protein coupled receptor G6 [Aplochiton taeniatus]
MEPSMGAGRRWKFRNVLPVALLWMVLHSPALGCLPDSCVLDLSEVQGEFSSPCYPGEYPKSQACKWTLKAPPGFIIQISFLHFELEEALGCIYDRVVVATGNADVRFCGLTANGLTLNSTGNVMELSFTSDFSVQKKGFRVSYRQVAVALRNQKVTLTNGNSKVVKVASGVALGPLHHLTLCLEIARVKQKQKESVFTYLDPAGGTALALACDKGSMELTVAGQICTVETVLTSSDITSTLKQFCLTWESASGRVAFFFDGNYRALTCGTTAGQVVASSSGGLLSLGGQESLDGTLYNFRLWDSAMTVQQLAGLTCDAQGNVVDWDNSYWDIPATLAQTDSTLSCICYPNCIHLTTRAPSSGTSLPTYTTPTTSCTSPALGCPAPLTPSSTDSTNIIHPATNATADESLFYRMSFVVSDDQGVLAESDIHQTVALWLNQTFHNWTYDVHVDYISYSVLSLLVYRLSTNASLSEVTVSARLASAAVGLPPRFTTSSISVQAVENCPEERPLHYQWAESRPTVTQHLPCFPNKEQTVARTCVMSPQNYTAYWSAPDLTNCTDIDTILVSADNAVEVAVQLADITNNELSTEEVSKVVNKVQELVDVAKINATLAVTVVTIISNVMSSSKAVQAATSDRALRTVDELVQKIQFEGPSVSITSKNLALGISALNASHFNGTSFSAFMAPNTSNPQIGFESDQVNPLAQVTLPPTLLSNLTMTTAERDSLSRINFLFFSKTALFQTEQDGLSLNSYVVASSVGNFTISNLQDPVEIEIVHLFYQPQPKPVCMFWDFTMKDGVGGWNRKGCRVDPQSNSNKTVCLCDHLTHFGILMDISGAASQIDENSNRILTFITYVGCGLSAIFSAATLLTYIAFEKLRRDYPSKILMNLSTSLLFLNMVFLLDGWLASFDVQGLCVAVALFLHYFLLTSFTWMGLESVHMYIALVKVFNTYIRRYILKFCIIGWGVPALVVTIVVAVDTGSYGKQQYGKGDSRLEASEFCWIQSSVVFYTTCVGYFCLVFLLNVAMFIVVMIQICGRNGKHSNRTLREEVLRNLRSVVSLTFLLGMTWGFAFFAWGPVNLAFMYLFTIFNSLQGLFIFIFHCAMKENVQKQWRRYLCCGRFRLADNSDWSKTATNNTKKVSSDNLGKSLSSSSFGSSTANWTSKAKATLNPFTKRHSNTGKGYQTTPKCVSSSSCSSEGEPSSSSSSSIIPVSQVIDKVRGYCSSRSDNFYKNFIMSDSFSNSTKF